jgi:hypothetical protein
MLSRQSKPQRSLQLEYEAETQYASSLKRKFRKTSLEYKCIDISKILKAIHIIPNFMDGAHFFINKYKF